MLRLILLLSDISLKNEFTLFLGSVIKLALKVFSFKNLFNFLEQSGLFYHLAHCLIVLKYIFSSSKIFKSIEFLSIPIGFIAIFALQ